MSHENLLAGYRTREVLHELNEGDDGLDQLTEQVSREVFHETGSVPIVRKEEEHLSRQHDLVEDYDPLTSDIALVERQVHRDFPDFKANTVSGLGSEWSLENPQTTDVTPLPVTANLGVPEHRKGWSLLGLRSMQGFREMRPPEVVAEFTPTIGDTVAESQGMRSFERYSQNLKDEIATLGRFDWDSVETPAPQSPETSEAPQIEIPEPKPAETALVVQKTAKQVAKVTPDTQDHPTLNMRIPGFAPKPTHPISVMPLGQAFPSPKPDNGNAAIRRLADQAAELHDSSVPIGPENLERIDPPKIPGLKSSGKEPSVEEVVDQAIAMAAKELPPAPRFAEISSAPSAEHITDSYEVPPLEFSLHSLEKSVGNFLNRHKKAARIAEYAGAAVVAAAAGSRLLRRLRGRH